jgi:hypothetical protein
MASIISASTTSGTALNMSADTTGVLQLATGATPTTAVTIDTSQNVGIGTASPSYKVDIVGANGQGIRWTDTVNSVQNYFGSYNSAGLLGTLSNHPLAFYTNNAERMRIDSGGALLLATTSTASFTQTGTLYIGDRGAVDCIQTYRNSTGASGQIGFNNPNGRVGEIYTSGSSTVYATSSDYRLKENIVPMTGALDVVSALKPVSYKWKVDGSDGQGFIAHELQAIVPDCVSGEKDAVDEEGNPIHQGIDTSFLVATLTAAIQEQQTIINDLKARITALEGAA